TVAGILNYYHVSTLYENDRYFSHLSSLEREMCFRSEMGLYYSFFKRIVTASSYYDGILDLTHDNLTEYPSHINALGKFNIYPEAIIGGMFLTYRDILHAFGSPGKECFQINRGNGFPPVHSCVGLGEPIFFYLEVVWIFAGLTAFLIFCYGTHLSGSVIGGCFTIVSFFSNHAESTRVQWTPPLRESFAYPMIVLHLMIVSNILKCPSAGKRFLKGCFLSFTSCICLLFWQFPQFILACEVVIIVVMYSIGLINKILYKFFLQWLSVGFMLALAGLMGNQLLLFSFLTTILIMAWIIYALDRKVNQLTLSWGSVGRICVTISFAVLLKYSLPITGNDSHIVKMFLSKIFKDMNDFHTLMYTCAPEFQGLPWAYAILLTKSFLIPLLLVVFVCIFWFEIHQLNPSFTSPRSFQKHNYSLKIHELRISLKRLDLSIVFNILLLAVYFLLAMMAMRLKLFLTPQMCVLVSLIASEKVLNVFPFISKMKHRKTSFLLVLLGILCFLGSTNIKKQHDIQGEYSNYPLEELLTWIENSTSKDSVFAGPMPIMASILLSTGRPIVNHPYYEDQEMRARTLESYSVFSRKPSTVAYEAIQQLGANFVVLEANKCFENRQRRGCKMTDLWDIQDPLRKMRPALCPKLFNGDASPFVRVFKNSEYVVLHLRKVQGGVDV
ncbi:putative C-mannosyltransferase DPY19L1, partial [Frankliniella fusca]